MAQRDRDQRYPYYGEERNRDWNQDRLYESGQARGSYQKPGGYAQVNYNQDDERDHFNSAGGNYNSQYGYSAQNQGRGYDRQQNMYGSTNYGNQYGDPYGNRRTGGYNQNRYNEPYGTPQGTGYGYGGHDYLNERRYGSGPTAYRNEYNQTYRREKAWDDRRDYSYRGDDRDWWDRTRDEVASWFGDDDAERRRQADRMRGPHYGKGPRGYKRSDDRIREDINDRLSDDDYVDASDIEVTVNEGDVLLSGTVNNRQAKRRAEDIAESVRGVSNVENRIRVGHTATTVSNATATTQEEDKTEEGKRKKSGWL